MLEWFPSNTLVDVLFTITWSVFLTNKRQLFVRKMHKRLGKSDFLDHMEYMTAVTDVVCDSFVR